MCQKKKKKDSTISIFFILPALSLSIALSYSSLRSWLLINFKTFLFFYYFLGNQTEFFTRVFFFSISYWFPHQDHHHRIDFTKLVLLHSDVHTFPYPNPSIWYFFYFSWFRSFESLFLISLFLLGLEFCPYFVIRFEYFELLWFLFLNLKCYVKIEFVILWIACFQCAFNVIEFVVLTCWLLWVSAHFGCIIMSFRWLVDRKSVV